MLADRAVETSTTTGTGTFSLAGVVVPDIGAGYRTFVSAAGSGATVAYIVEMGAVWEINYGVITAGTPDTLTRVFIASSTGAAINWAAGTKSVYSAATSDVVRFGGVGAVPTATGTANALAIAHLPPLRALRPGMVFRWIIANTNSGAATLAVDSVSAADIRKLTGVALVAGDLVAGQIVQAVWDGTYFRLISAPISAYGATLVGAAAAAAARAVLVAPALPTNAAGVGQRTMLVPGSNVALTLPAGGTWDYVAIGYVLATGALVGAMFTAGVAAGGTVVGAAGGAGNGYLAFVWRIA